MSNPIQAVFPYVPTCRNAITLLLGGCLFLTSTTTLNSAFAAVPAAKEEAKAVQAYKASAWREAVPSTDNPSTLSLQAAFPDSRWWERYQDPLLNGYIQEAIRANLTLAIAHERINEAQGLAHYSLGAELPHLAFSPSFTRQHSSANTVRVRSATTGTASGGNTANTSATQFGGLGQTLNFYTIPLVANYEVDLWGKNRDATKALNKQTDATVRDFESAHITLVTDVANAYFNLIAADGLIELHQNVIQSATLDLQHAQNRYAAGLTDSEDVVLRQGRLTDYRAELQDYYQMQATALNQLSILLGRTPYQVAHLERAGLDKYSVPDEIQSGLPSDLVARRPDILAAEDRLMAAGYQVRVARKQFLPTFNLVGQFGYSSISHSNLFDWDSHLASIAASGAQNLFMGGQTRANLKVYKSRYQQQLLTYHNTILTSFKEVEDALAGMKSHRNAYQEYANSLDSFNQQLKIEQNRVNAGAASDFDIQPVRLEQMLAAEGLAKTKLSAMTDSLSLYKALGGGY